MINTQVGGIVMYYSADNNMRALPVCNYHSMTDVKGGHTEGSETNRGHRKSHVGAKLGPLGL